MERDQNVARENVRWLARARGMTLKGLADVSGIAASTLYNWLRATDPETLGDKSSAKLAETLSVAVEQLFYNAPHEQAGGPPQIPEDWREQIREIERYVRSIEDPAERLATVRRLLSIARTDVEVWERSRDRGADARAAAPGAGPAPGARPGRHGRSVG